MAENSYRRSLRESVDPGLPGKKSRDEEKRLAQEATRANLRAGEEAASGDSSQSGENEAAAGSENAASLNGREQSKNGGFYSNRSNEKGERKSGKFFGRSNNPILRKAGPLITILMLLGGAGATVGWMQWLMPAAIVEQATEMFDGSFTARQMRMPKLMKYVMNIENDSTRTTKRHLGVGYKKFRRGVVKNEKRLKEQGIEIIGDGDNKKLKWTSQRTGETVEISADEYEDIYRNNREFRNDYNRGARSYMGRIAAWIDLTCARFLANYGLTRNLFKDWQKGVFDAEGKTTKFNEIIRGRRPSINIDGGEGEIETKKIGGDDSELYIHSDKGKSESTPSTKEGISNKLSSIASTITNLSCAKAAVGAAAVTIGISLVHENSRNFFSAVAEASDKVKAGDGATSPIHEAGFDMTEKDKNGKSAMESEGMKFVTSQGAYKPDMNNESIKLMNLDLLYREAGVTVATTVVCAQAKIAVAAVSLVLTFVPLVSQTKTAAKEIFSVGKTILAGATTFGVSALLGAGIEAYLNSITTDKCTAEAGEDRGNCTAIGAASMIQKNFQNGGGTYASKGKAMEYYDAQQMALEWEAEYDRDTKSPFDTSSGNTFLGSIVRDISLPASQISSPAGFFSSVGNVISSSMSSILPSAKAISRAEYAQNQIGECVLAEGVGAVGNSLDCSAIDVTDIGTMKMDPEQVLSDIVDVSGGSAFEMNGDEIATDENGMERINENSNLGKYIKYCSYRETPVGVVDQNILVDNNPTVIQNMAADAAVSAIPGVGDLFDIMNAAGEIDGLAWATGANCVARGDDQNSITFSDSSVGTSETVKNSTFCIGFIMKCKDREGSVGADYTMDANHSSYISWKEAKLYQRYVEDDRLLESVNGDKSAVSTAVAKWEAENPLDNSLEGAIARNTGMLKKDVSVALNEMLYWEYLADYDPTDAYPTPVVKREAKMPETPKRLEMPEKTIAVVPQKVVYAVVRMSGTTA